jgi:hypothetical protein
MPVVTGLLLAGVLSGTGGGMAVGSLRLDGVYFRGDGLGEQFTLAIKGGRFKYSRDGCAGAVEAGDGRVEIQGDGSVQFVPNRSATPAPLPDSELLGPWMPIPWGDRLYLVNSGHLQQFVNDVNLGREPRRTATGSYLLREEDHLSSVKGQPDLPPEWRPFLLPRRLKGRLLKVLPGGSGQLSLGSRDGLRVGMQLIGRNASDGWCHVTVERVDAEASIVSPVPGVCVVPLVAGQQVVSRP